MRALKQREGPGQRRDGEGGKGKDGVLNPPPPFPLFVLPAFCQQRAAGQDQHAPGAGPAPCFLTARRFIRTK